MLLFHHFQGHAQVALQAFLGGIFLLGFAHQLLRGIDPVSYTHLDVYKRQIQIRVKKTLPSSSKSGASQRARGVGEVAGIGAPA